MKVGCATGQFVWIEVVLEVLKEGRESRKMSDTKIQSGQKNEHIPEKLSLILLAFGIGVMGVSLTFPAGKKGNVVNETSGLLEDRAGLNESNSGHPLRKGPFCEACSEVLLQLLKTGEVVEPGN